MSIRADKELLSDILNSIEKIETYIENINYTSFLNDPKTQDAIVRNIEIIGEAANNITDKTKDNYNLIPWNKIKGTRNRLIHNYSGVNLDILWNIIKEDIPDLYMQIKQITDPE